MSVPIKPWCQSLYKISVDGQTAVQVLRQQAGTGFTAGYESLTFSQASSL